MPATRMQRGRAYVRLNMPWRKLWATRVVKRRVQGVDLYLPWSHALPDFAILGPNYGQNLTALAVALEKGSDAGGLPMQVMDIGANIGDSAAQIIAATGSEVLCVEGDPYWADFLRRNLGENPRAVIEEALLTPDDGTWGDVSPVRSRGTTRFAAGTGISDSLPALPMGALRAKHPSFDRLRLVKSDTDGFDPVLVVAAAETWSDVSPVLFFEFDPTLARKAGNSDPNAMWDKLGRLGYTRLAVWDNCSDPLGQMDIADAPRQAATLEPRPSHLGYHFWDVGACKSDDAVALAAFDQLVPDAFNPMGIWR